MEPISEHKRFGPAFSDLDAQAFVVGHGVEPIPEGSASRASTSDLFNRMAFSLLAMCAPKCDDEHPGHHAIITFWVDLE